MNFSQCHFFHQEMELCVNVTGCSLSPEWELLLLSLFKLQSRMVCVSEVTALVLDLDVNF